jgi:hypothetical protein
VGGGDIQAIGPARVRLITALAAIALAAALAVGPVVGSGDRRPLLLGIALVGMLATLIAVAGWVGATWWAVIAFGAEYTLVLVGRGSVDLGAALVAVGLFLLAELTLWSVDARAPIVEDARSVGRRLIQLGALSLIAAALGALIVSAGRLGPSAGLSLTLVGVAGSVGILVLLAWVSLDHADRR